MPGCTHSIPKPSKPHPPQPPKTAELPTENAWGLRNSSPRSWQRLGEGDWNQWSKLFLFGSFDLKSICWNGYVGESFTYFGLVKVLLFSIFQPWICQIWVCFQTVGINEYLDRPPSVPPGQHCFISKSCKAERVATQIEEEYQRMDEVLHGFFLVRGGVCRTRPFYISG